MEIIFLGGKQAGCIGLLTLLAMGHHVRCVVPYSDDVHAIADAFHLKHYESANGWQVKRLGAGADLLVCVHGREIVEASLYDNCFYGGVNAHPCLSSFPGANPIERFLVSPQYPNATVGVHRMTGDIDRGEVLMEIPVNVSGAKTVIEVYNLLYPVYSTALIGAIGRL